MAIEAVPCIDNRNHTPCERSPLGEVISGLEEDFSVLWHNFSVQVTFPANGRVTPEYPRNREPKALETQARGCACDKISYLTSQDEGSLAARVFHVGSPSDIIKLLNPSIPEQILMIIRCFDVHGLIVGSLGGNPPRNPSACGALGLRAFLHTAYALYLLIGKLLLPGTTTTQQSGISRLNLSEVHPIDQSLESISTRTKTGRSLCGKLSAPSR
ncbi:hypothetical protein B0T26DRAFT_192710 [Lasiosphaeria miniovina]|uniref:Uncharacterized protein n=1 Tax=Lasiosphaeria miniovina TaxID=1954250 RepID=A0AA40E1S8_9PEZI|nr:uncharacterized protein B0T26DRAFT_192710 [Lasiosphaeria miniovina]KAK0721792.1 hypothetical protein B0T26DRAFT_192710 [Lasiosphaeria miniovina]